MGKYFWIVTLSAIMLMVAGGCDFEGNKKLPADVVRNPNSAEGKKKEKMPEITFDKTEHDFGSVISGEVVSYSFKFENTGNAVLIISNVSTSCGCTVTDYPQEPIKPGEEKYLEVTFDSNHRSGYQSKTITVGTNAQPSTKSLRIKAKVTRP